MSADRTACRAAPLGQVASRAVTALLIVLAVGFAWSIGAHYTGAVMGMPHALRAIGAWPALLLMAPLAFLGATFASHAVERRGGSGLTAVPLSVERQVVVIGVAFAVTTFFNRFRMPTSTIQILVFSIIGVSLATGIGVNWGAIGHLVIVWAVAPVAAIFLGYLLTLGLDHLRLTGSGRRSSRWVPSLPSRWAPTTSRTRAV